MRRVRRFPQLLMPHARRIFVVVLVVVPSAERRCVSCDAVVAGVSAAERQTALALAHQ
jgi:hypothetical protein